MTDISKLIAINNYQDFRKNIQYLFKMGSSCQVEVQEDDQQPIIPNHKQKIIQNHRKSQKQIKIQLIQDYSDREKVPYKEIKIKNRYNFKHVIHLEQENEHISQIENEKTLYIENQKISLIENQKTSQNESRKSQKSWIQQLIDFNIQNSEKQWKASSFIVKETIYQMNEKNRQNLLLREEIQQINRDTFNQGRRYTTEQICPKERCQINAYRAQLMPLNKEIQTIILDEINTTSQNLLSTIQQLLPCKNKNKINSIPSQVQISTKLINIINLQQQDNSIRELNQVLTINLDQNDNPYISGQKDKQINNTIKITLQEIKDLLKQLPTIRKCQKQQVYMQNRSFKKFQNNLQQSYNYQLQERNIHKITKGIQAIDLLDKNDRPSSPIQKLIELQQQDQLNEIHERKLQKIIKNTQNNIQKASQKPGLHNLIQLHEENNQYPQQYQEIIDQQCSETNFNFYLSQLMPDPSVSFLNQTPKLIKAKKIIKNNKTTQRAIRQQLQGQISILQCINEDGNDVYIWRVGPMQVAMSFRQAFQKLPYMYLLMQQKYSSLLQHYSLHQISNNLEQIEIDEIILNQASGGLERGFDFCKLTSQKQNKYQQAIKNIVKIFQNVLQHKFRLIFLQNLSKQNIILRVQRSQQRNNSATEQNIESQLRINELRQSQVLQNSRLSFRSLNFKQQNYPEQNVRQIQLAATLSRSEYKKLMQLNMQNNKQVILKVKLIGQQPEQNKQI